MAEEGATVVERKKFALVVLLLQALILFLFGIFVEYSEGQAKPGSNLTAYRLDSSANSIDKIYPMWQDVHGMMFIGFGFLMAFLARYGYSSIGLNFLLGAFVLEWATLVLGFFHQHDDYDKQIELSIDNMLTADFAAAAVMISFGAVLGKVSALQLLAIAFFEIIFFAVNEMVGVRELKAVDIGGSMFVHTFGAYFGLALTRMLASRTEVARKESPKEGSIYHSDIFAMLGTIVLWLYWPSFNAALGVGDQRHRAVINTYYSLSACVVMTFVVSSAVNKDSRFDMVHIQNATLAGGVAIGNSADFLIEPWGAVFVGMTAAVVSVLGYKYVQPFLQSRLKIHDTCGVHNLHGLPGVLAAIVAVIATASISTAKYGHSLYQVYPPMAPESKGALMYLDQLGYEYETGEGRNTSQQAGFQMAALCVTLAIALLGGTITGLVIRQDWFMPPKDNGEEMFDDQVHWHVADDACLV